jgi:aspartate aminotransferase
MTFEAQRVQLIQPSPIIVISQMAQKLRAEGVDVIDLSVGEPDFDTPPHIVEAAYAAMRAGKTRYTAPDGMPELKDAIVAKFRRENGLAYDRSEISAANGGKQVLFNALFAAIEPGDEVIVPAPYWVSYIDMVLLLGGKPVIVPCGVETGFKMTPEMLEAAITPKSRWLILNSPSNPSGCVYSRAEQQALGAVVGRSPRLLVISDEVYEHVHYGTEPFVSFPAACPNLRERTVIVNAVSKTYAMTGWRLGYAAGPRGLIKAMGKLQSQSSSNPSSISQMAAIAALNGPQDFVRTSVAEYAKRRDIAVAGLSAIPGLEVARPEGAFYVFPKCAGLIGKRTSDGKTLANDTDVVAYLLTEGRVAAVQGVAYGVEPYFRISFALSQADLSRAIDRIGAAVANLD